MLGIFMLMCFIVSNGIATIGYCNIKLYAKYMKLSQCDNMKIRASVNKRLTILSLVPFGLWLFSINLIFLIIDELSTIKVSAIFHSDVLIYYYCICVTVITLLVNFISIYERETYGTLAIIGSGFLSYIFIMVH